MEPDKELSAEATAVLTPPDELALPALLIPPSLRARFRKGIVWNFIASASGMGAHFAVNLMVAKMLGKDAFGRFTMVQNTLMTFSGLASLSMGLAATKYLAEFRAKDKEQAGRILGLCSLVSIVMAGVVSLVLLAASPWVAASQLKSPDLATALRVGTAFLFFASITGYQTGALAGLESYRASGIANLLSGALTLIVCAASIRFYGISGAFIGLSGSAMLRYAIHRHFLAAECVAAGIQFSYRHLSELQGILFRFAIPAAMSGYFTLPMFWLANVILFQQPNGAASMALYGAAASVRVMVLFLPITINSVGVSILTHTKGTGDMRGFRRMYWNNVAAVVGTIVLFGIPIALFGRVILSLFGKGFQDAYPVILVVLVAAVAEGLSVSLFQMIQAHERMWFAFLGVIVPRELTLVGAAYLLAPRYGATGLALAYCIAWTLAAGIILTAGLFMQPSEPGEPNKA